MQGHPPPVQRLWRRVCLGHHGAHFAVLVLVQSLSCVQLLQPHGLQHARLLCPSLSPGICSNSCPLSWRCHPTISSSAAPFSFCLQSFPALVSFPMSWLSASSGQSIGTSALASVLPMNTQGWFPLGFIGLISMWSKGLSRASPPQFKSMRSSALNPSLTSVHDYWKNHKINHRRYNFSWS